MGLPETLEDLATRWSVQWQSVEKIRFSRHLGPALFISFHYLPGRVRPAVYSREGSEWRIVGDGVCHSDGGVGWT